MITDIPPSVLPTPTTSRKPPSRIKNLPDEIDKFTIQDRIHSLSDITKEDCPQGYDFKAADDEVMFFKLCTEGKRFQISEAIKIDKMLHVKLYSSGSPLPLPEWLRNGNSKCKITKKSILQNLPSYIKNFVENRSETQILSDKILEEFLQIRYKKPEVNEPKFSKDLIQLSLMLKYTSASSYRLMQQYFPLPSASYLRSLCEGSLDPVKSIKVLLENQKIDKDIVLLMDEMYLQREVQYHEGKLTGCDEDGTMFRGIMTFMVVGLKNNVPFVIKAIPEAKIEGKWLSDHIDNCLQSLHDAGFKVRAVISDNHSTNVAAFRELCRIYGDGTDNNTIIHPSSDGVKTYLMYDSVHLLKNVRNNLLNNKRFIFPAFSSKFITVPSGEISYKFVHDVYDKDLELQANLRKAHKLTYKALHPGDNKQSVPLALAIFDATTSAAIDSYYPERKDAAMFLRLINIWWTMSNSKSRFNGNFHIGDAARPDDSKPEFLRQLSQWVSEWTNSQCRNSQKFTLSKQTSTALITTLRCTASLIEDLLGEGYAYVLTSRFQTDPLELRFSKYRQMSGGRFLVGLREVESSERILSIKSLLKESISSYENIYMDQNCEEESNKLKDQIDNMSEEIDTCYLNDHSVEVVKVIAGYIARKLDKQSKCADCTTFFSANSDDSSLVHDDMNYIHLLNRGGLLLPTAELVEYTSKSFAILDVLHEVIVNSKLPARKAAELALSSNASSISFFCDTHTHCIKIVNRTISNIFLNNFQKITKDKVRCDAVKDFKQRQRKRRREE